MAIRTRVHPDGTTMFITDEPVPQKSWIKYCGKVPFTSLSMYQIDGPARAAAERKTVITDPELLARIVEDDREAAFRAPFLTQLRKDMGFAP